MARRIRMSARPPRAAQAARRRPARGKSRESIPFVARLLRWISDPAGSRSRAGVAAGRAGPADGKPATPPGGRARADLAREPKRARSARRGLHVAPERLALARERFETGSATIAAIARDLGCSPRTVHEIARREAWVRRAPREVPRSLRLLAELDRLETSPCGTARADMPPGDGPQPSGEGQTAPACALPPLAETVERIYRAALEELAKVEAVHARLQHAPRSALDAERTARTLATLQTLMERLEQQKIRLLGTAHDDDIPEDIDAFREALAQRIEAFMESRRDEEFSEPPAASPGEGVRA